MVEKIVIMGAAGKDFHVFNTCFREKDDARVVAFTATQIPHIEGRIYPPTLAGPNYPKGIPILPEEELPHIIEREKVDRVIFAYSDVSYDYVAEREKIARAAGADFETAPVEEAMLPSEKPVIAVCAVRTGCGKSQTTRRVSEILREMGLKCVVVRHPMPYGDLVKQRVQRFASVEDMEAQNCTIEEMEEYEHHIARGNVVYAGVDYEAILREAEKEADLVLWDGGNNDIPFFKPDLWITVLDPHRPGHELLYYPGKENFLRAKVLVVNKVDSADPANVEKVLANAREYNPSALVIQANSPVTISDPDAIRGKRVVVVEDGPTLTHGGMTFGAGTLAAEKYGATEIVDPKPYFVGEMKETLEKYPNIGKLVPAMGYGKKQLQDLQATLDAVPCDAVVVATPIDLARIIEIKKPSVRVFYSLEEITSPGLEEVVAEVIS